MCIFPRTSKQYNTNKKKTMMIREREKKGKTKTLIPFIAIDLQYSKKE